MHQPAPNIQYTDTRMSFPTILCRHHTRLTRPAVVMCVGVVGKRLPPLQSHAIEWARDWVRVIAALHHAIDKVEKPSLDGIRDDDDPDRPHQSSSHLFPSSLFCFLVLANQLSRCGYSFPTLLETKPPFS